MGLQYNSKTQTAVVGKGYWRQTHWSHPLCTCSSTSLQLGSSTATLWSHGFAAKVEVERQNKHMTEAESSLQPHVLWMLSDVSSSYLHLWAGGDKDILGRQEKNDAHGPCIHLGNGDSEDQDPGEEAGQGVDNHQGRKPQQQPQVGGEATLGNRKHQTETYINILFCLLHKLQCWSSQCTISMCIWSVESYPVGSARRSLWWLWEWHLLICGWRQQNWGVIFL